jgi:hypothetical protein
LCAVAQPLDGGERGAVQGGISAEEVARADQDFVGVLGEVPGGGGHVRMVAHPPRRALVIG